MNKRLNPWGSLMIIAGILIPAASFFMALWQNHPDPSAFKPGELGELRLTVLEGKRGFICEETGEFLSILEIDIPSSDEAEYERFVEENVFVRGRLEVAVAHIVMGGLALAAAGVVVCSARGA